MKKTTQEAFWEEIGKEDVVLEVAGNYPYTVIFRTRRGRVEVGMIKDNGTFTPSDYFFTGNQSNL